MLKKHIFVEPSMKPRMQEPAPDVDIASYSLLRYIRTNLLAFPEDGFASHGRLISMYSVKSDYRMRLVGCSVLLHGDSCSRLLIPLTSR